MSKRVAVLFPGIGYHCDKPLLYYAGKLAMSADYQVILVPYKGFPAGVKGNKEKMEQSFYMGLEQAEDMLEKVEWADFDEILFISKSVGTIVAGAYAKKHHLKVKHVAFTPLVQTFAFSEGDTIMFHGTADPWADTEDIKAGCGKLGIPLYITENANHSLETGNVDLDLRNLASVMNTVEYFIR